MAYSDMFKDIPELDQPEVPIECWSSQSGTHLIEIPPIRFKIAKSSWISDQPVAARRSWFSVGDFHIELGGTSSEPKALVKFLLSKEEPNEIRLAATRVLFFRRAGCPICSKASIRDDTAF